MTAPSPAWMEKSRGKPSRYPGNFLGVAPATSPVLSSRFSSDSQGKRERERILRQPKEFRNSPRTRNHPWSSTWRKFPFPAFPSQSRLRLGSGWIPGMGFFFPNFLKDQIPLCSRPLPFPVLWQSRGFPGLGSMESLPRKRRGRRINGYLIPTARMRLFPWIFPLPAGFGIVPAPNPGDVWDFRDLLHLETPGSNP